MNSPTKDYNLDSIQKKKDRLVMMQRSFIL